MVIGLISNLYSKMIKQYYFLSKITVSLVYVQNVTWRTVLIYIKIWQLLFTLSPCQMTRISLFEFNNWFNWEIIQITGSFFFFNIPLLFLKIPPFFQKVPITAQSKKIHCLERLLIWKQAQGVASCVKWMVTDRQMNGGVIAFPELRSSSAGCN